MKVSYAHLAVAIGCTFFGFGAGVFFTIHEPVWGAVCLVLAAATWLTTSGSIERRA